ncbi:uncharacterized protein LOC122511130 [Leptopilina heterotoma]|uniref:uncharacterized protein LOC122511130 n=1 Tax=Leptopilina heterotoma TaxID=63436 RepID=UPI001CA86536|nr:uncharacterized protein LOC122511130 [Leptopilina heterotoma]
MEEQVLISGDGYFTIVYKKSIIFDSSNPDLQFGSEISYCWPEEAACKRIYKGKVIATSTDEKELKKLQLKMQNAEKNTKSKNKRRKISLDSSDCNTEDESTPNSSLNKINTALHLNKELNIVLNQIKQRKTLFIWNLFNLLSNFKYIVLLNFLLAPQRALILLLIRPLLIATKKKKSESKNLKNPTERQSIIVDKEPNLKADEGAIDITGEESDDTAVKKKNDENEDDFLVFTKETANAEKATELFTGSDVYIDKLEFKNIKRTAGSQTSLARSLMVAIFKEKALITCSLFRKGNKDAETKCLPNNAVKAILSFSRRFAATKEDWKLIDDTAVKDSMRSKLKEMRKKSKKESKSSTK